jgi:hypothetical protein
MPGQIDGAIEEAAENIVLPVLGAVRRAGNPIHRAALDACPRRFSSWQLWRPEPTAVGTRCCRRTPVSQKAALISFAQCPSSHAKGATVAMKSTEGEAFVMSARLVEISELVADLPLSRVMLANDARFPWLSEPVRPADSFRWVTTIGAPRADLI